MRIQNTRIWAFFIAAAFLILWCASVGVTVASPRESVEDVQEPSAAAVYVESSPGTQVIGILGWSLVGLGFLGVGLTVLLNAKPRRKRRTVHFTTSRQPRKRRRSVYGPPHYRSSWNVERRR